MDIVIYTRQEVLDHKLGCNPNEGEYFYWEFGRFPKNIKRGDRTFFAVKGKVLGSFKIRRVDKLNYEIEWSCKSWKPLKEKIPCKPFRGFRYKWWKDE